MSGLHQACARAIAPWLAGDNWEEPAAAAIRVCLAEAQRTVERVRADCDWRGRDALDMALVALKRLGEQA